jgi:hypothetical protein
VPQITFSRERRVMTAGLGGKYVYRELKKLMKNAFLVCKIDKNISDFDADI